MKNARLVRYLSMLLCVLGVSVCLNAVNAQQVVTGTVTDGSGEPIIGANILVKGQSIGAVSDVNGEFSLSVSSSEDILVVSYIGYETVEVKVGKRTK